MSYYIAILYDKTLKKFLQKKKCAAKVLQSKKKKVVLVLDSNLCQYPQQLQGGACTQLFCPVVLQRNATQFLPTYHLQRAVADKRNCLKACNKLRLTK